MWGLGYDGCHRLGTDVVGKLIWVDCCTGVNLCQLLSSHYEDRSHLIFPRMRPKTVLCPGKKLSVVGLYVVVEVHPAGAPDPRHVEVFFARLRGFTFLDGGDLPHWVRAACFQTKHLVFNVVNGGWLSEEPPKALNCETLIARATPL